MSLTTLYTYLIIRIFSSKLIADSETMTLRHNFVVADSSNVHQSEILYVKTEHSLIAAIKDLDYSFTPLLLVDLLHVGNSS